VFCGKCGNQVFDEEEFCGKCGSKIEVEIDENIEKENIGDVNEESINPIVAPETPVLQDSPFHEPNEELQQPTPPKNKRKENILIGLAIFVCALFFIFIFPALLPSHTEETTTISNTAISDTIVELSDNSFGMRFKTTMDEYIANYNALWSESSDADKAFFTVERKDFKLVEGKDYDASPNVYVQRYIYTFYNLSTNEEVFDISLDVESGTEKLVAVQYIFSPDFVATLSEDGKTFYYAELPAKIFGSISSDLDSKEILDNFNNSLKDNTWEFSQNIIYRAGVDKNNCADYQAFAASDDYYNSHYGETSTTEVITEQPTESTTSETETTTTTNANNYVVNTGIDNNNLNMRSGPGETYSDIGNIPNGTKLYISEITDGWGHTEYKGKDCWVSMDYLEAI